MGDVEDFRYECNQRLRTGLKTFRHLGNLRGECGILRGTANDLGHDVDGIHRIANVVRDRVEEARLATARLLGLLASANQLLVLTDDLRFVGDEQVVGHFELPILVLEKARLSFPDVQRHHPHMDKARRQQQRDSVEYAVDKQRLVQFERAGRYLQPVDDEGREHERDRQSPQQAPTAGEGRQHERDAVNRRDVEFRPGAGIRDHFGHREHDRANACEGNRAVGKGDAGNSLRFDARDHFVRVRGDVRLNATISRKPDARRRGVLTSAVSVSRRIGSFAKTDLLLVRVVRVALSRMGLRWRSVEFTLRRSSSIPDSRSRRCRLSFDGDALYRPHRTHATGQGERNE